MASITVKSVRSSTCHIQQYCLILHWSEDHSKSQATCHPQLEQVPELRPYLTGLNELFLRRRAGPGEGDQSITSSARGTCSWLLPVLVLQKDCKSTFPVS